MLEWRIGSWLLSLADPTGPRRPLPADRLRSGELACLLTYAEQHRVLPSVVRNLRRVQERVGAERILVPRPAKPSAEESFRTALGEADRRLQRRKVLSVVIARQVQELTAALTERPLAAVIVKGPDFATRLYPNATRRYFRDVDVLTRPGDLGEVDRLMRDLGYTPAPGPLLRRRPTGQEHLWWPAGRPGALVEIHGNMLDLPGLRRRVSVDLDDLDLEPPSPGAGGLPRLTPTSMLLLAAVHVALSHTFGRLQGLFDVCQAARGAAGPIEAHRLADMASRTGSEKVIAAALLLAREAFREPACVALLGRLEKAGVRWRRGALAPVGLWLMLVSPGLVARPRSPVRRLLREALRQLWKLP